MFARLGRFSVRFRFVIVAFWVIATILSVKFLPSLSSVANNQNSAFLPASAPSNQAAQLATPFERSDLATGVIIAATSDHTPPHRRRQRRDHQGRGRGRQAPAREGRARPGRLVRR